MANEFAHDKHYLSNKMNSYIHLLLFPKTLCDSLENYGYSDGLYKLSNYMNLYNRHLLYLRAYYNKLHKIKKFGYIFATFEQWKNRIDMVIYNIIKYRKKILVLLDNASEKEKIYYYQCKVDISKIYTFMNIYKLTYDYFICYEVVGEVQKIEYNEIVKLLPVCKYVEYNIVETEEVQHLEYSDMVPRAIRC